MVVPHPRGQFGFEDRPRPQQPRAYRSFRQVQNLTDTMRTEFFHRRGQKWFAKLARQGVDQSMNFRIPIGRQRRLLRRLPGGSDANSQLRRGSRL
jgi:hypothetical protein